MGVVYTMESMREDEKMEVVQDERKFYSHSHPHTCSDLPHSSSSPNKPRTLYFSLEIEKQECIDKSFLPLLKLRVWIFLIVLNCEFGIAPVKLLKERLIMEFSETIFSKPNGTFLEILLLERFKQRRFTPPKSKGRVLLRILKENHPKPQ